MAADGPSQVLAYEEGDAVTNDILELLRVKYKIERPVALNDTDVQRQSGKRWDQLQRNLRKTVREIVWNDHASSF